MSMAKSRGYLHRGGGLLTEEDIRDMFPDEGLQEVWIAKAFKRKRSKKAPAGPAAARNHDDGPQDPYLVIKELNKRFNGG